MSLKPIAIYGAGGFGSEVLMLINQINLQEPTWQVIGFLDDGVAVGTIVDDLPVLGGLDFLNKYDKELAVTLAIGSPYFKKKIATECTNNKISFPTLVYPGFQLHDFQKSSVGRGCIICQDTIITTNVDIGDFVIINLACTVGHDTVIGNYASFMPGVNISGEVVIEEGAYFGTAACIINQKRVGANSTIGAGSVVVKDIPPNCTAVGSPAKPIKFHDK